MNKLIRKNLYGRWRGMKSRCYCVTNDNYKYYGARGITVCDEWKNNFEAFYIWAVNSGYSKELQIDRENNNLGYSPSNCRWTTPKFNVQNRNSNLLTQAKANEMRAIYKSSKGRKKNIAAIGRIFNVSRQVAHLVITNKRWV